MTRAEYVAILACQYGITLDARRSTRGVAFTSVSRVRISAVTGPVSYATALHELGHCIAPEATGHQYSRIHKEIRAWRWARWAALEWSDRMDSTMQDGLRYYVDRLRRRGQFIPSEVYQLLEEQG